MADDVGQPEFSAEDIRKATLAAHNPAQLAKELAADGQRLGSLCSGYMGLDLAVQAILDVEHAWVSDIDRHACAVLEARAPGVPNLGDMTTIDWREVEPVDVLTAGYPCQPFSHAGRRQGVSDVRNLWPFVADAVRVLRPAVVILENVAGHLSLGFDVVLRDLAELGFDAEWQVLRASDVGACHRRARVFIVATDTEGERCRLGRRPGTVEGEQVAGWPALEPGGRGDALPAEQGGRAIAGGADTTWGAYAGAIERHEWVLGRRAPGPVDDRGRLSPLFVEWMQMLPEGWVTEPVPVRSGALKLLGNGVIPLQAEVAVRHLIDRAERPVAA